MGRLEVEVEIDQGERGGSIHTVIRLDKALTEREVKILFNSARHCEVSKLLGGPISFDYKLSLAINGVETQEFDKKRGFSYNDSWS